MSESQLSLLFEAMQNRRFVRFLRRFETSHVRGYVVDIGPRFFLLALVSDRIWFDGFECFRIEDVSGVGPDPYTTFVEAASLRRGEQWPEKLRLNLSTIEELLRSAGRAFPLVSIHRERVDPNVCNIGRVVEVGGGRVSLLEIGPDARWDEAPTTYSIREITRVNFGGDYENALSLIGGDQRDGEELSS